MKWGRPPDMFHSSPSPTLLFREPSYLKSGVTVGTLGPGPSPVPLFLFSIPLFHVSPLPPQYPSPLFASSITVFNNIPYCLFLSILITHPRFPVDRHPDGRSSVPGLSTASCTGNDLNTEKRDFRPSPLLRPPPPPLRVKLPQRYSIFPFLHAPMHKCILSTFTLFL